MFLVELNTVPIFYSNNFVDIKKEIKKMVYELRSTYMTVGKVYAHYYNSRLCVDVILHPHNILNGIDKILCRIKTFELN